MTSRGSADTAIPADIGELIPETISECAVYLRRQSGQPCMSDSAVAAVAQAVGSVQSEPAQIVAEAKAKLSCTSERCVLEKLSRNLGGDLARDEIAMSLKISGPTDNSLLSNVDIDKTLRQWALVFRDFFPYNFNMLNYASYSYRNGRVLQSPDTLATVTAKDLLRKHRRAACVINSDRYQGGGKHWMALYVDAVSTPHTVEFFNSSGNSPAPEWINWLVKMRSQISLETGVQTEIVRVSNVRHQKSRSECGVYSLFYIWARLNGVSASRFKTATIPDKLMFEFRQHLFSDPSRADSTRFNWGEYQRQINIEWE